MVGRVRWLNFFIKFCSKNRKGKCRQLLCVTMAELRRAEQSKATILWFILYIHKQNMKTGTNTHIFILLFFRPFHLTHLLCTVFQYGSERVEFIKLKWKILGTMKDEVFHIPLFIFFKKKKFICLAVIFLLEMHTKIFFPSTIIVDLQHTHTNTYIWPNKNTVEWKNSIRDRTMHLYTKHLLKHLDGWSELNGK